MRHEFSEPGRPPVRITPVSSAACGIFADRPMRSFRLAFAAAIAICLLAVTGHSPACAQAELTVTKAAIGLGGKYKAGFWNPVWLTMQAGPQGRRAGWRLSFPTAIRFRCFWRPAGGQHRPGRRQGDEPAAVCQDRPAGRAGQRAACADRVGESKLWSQDISSLLAQPLLPTQELVVGIGPTGRSGRSRGNVKRPAGIALVTVPGAIGR